MKLPYLSNSRIETFNLCPFKYYAKYELGLPDPGNVRAKLGLLVHEVLETAARLICSGKEENILKKAAALPENLVEIYRECYDKSKIADDKSLFSEGLGILLKAIQRGILSDPSQILAIEKEFDITLENGVKLFGRIDRIDKVDEQSIEIIDYKTNQKVFTQREFSSNLQAGIYLAVAMQLFPDVPNHYFTFHFLRHGSYSLIRSTEELQQIAHELKCYWNRISELEGPSAKPKRNMFCNSCPFKFPNPALQYAGCPAFFGKEDQLSRFTTLAGEEPSPEEDVVTKLNQIEEQMTVLERQRNELRTELLESAASAFVDEDKVRIGRWDVFFNQKFRRQRNDQKTIRVCQKLGVDLEQFNKPDLNGATQWIKKNRSGSYDDCFDVNPLSIDIKIVPAEE